MVMSRYIFRECGWLATLAAEHVIFTHSLRFITHPRMLLSLINSHLPSPHLTDLHHTSPSSSLVAHTSPLASASPPHGDRRRHGLPPRPPPPAPPLRGGPPALRRLPRPRLLPPRRRPARLPEGDPIPNLPSLLSPPPPPRI